MSDVYQARNLHHVDGLKTGLRPFHRFRCCNQYFLLNVSCNNDQILAISVTFSMSVYV